MFLVRSIPRSYSINLLQDGCSFLEGFRSQPQGLDVGLARPGNLAESLDQPTAFTAEAGKRRGDDGFPKLTWKLKRAPYRIRGPSPLPCQF